MNEKESVKSNEQEDTSTHVKEVKRYSGEKNKKETVKSNETETGPRQSRGKKQRRQFKLAPNRG
jgi:hypothetical protein